MANRNSNVSSTTTIEQAGLQLVVPQSKSDRAEMSPWAPLVLSLDGGGVRGLSPLYIIRRIMLRIRELEAEESQDDNLRLPLPCHYFDNIVGVSTGGIIAIMLGRLRMDVNECIQQYYIICNKIFRPHKYIGHYSAKRFEDAINEVIRKYCKCHDRDGCQHPHTDYFRQYDYLEFDEGVQEDDENAQMINGTCRVAVLTQKKAHGKGQPDKVYLIRSYNHRRRPTKTRTYSTLNLNLGDVFSPPLRIWEACRATSAAPLYFDKILIDGSWHIDGGVGDNNPSTHAWNEANALARVRDGTNKCAMIVSIGTGMTEPQTKFGGLLSLAQYARKAITETEKAHEATQNLANQVDAKHFRFDVRPRRSVHEGLSKIKLDECKKKKKKKQQRPQQEQPRQEQPQQEQPPEPPQHQTVPALERGESHEEERTRILDEMDARNDREAAQPHVKGGYKPDKYDYTTFRTIKERTDTYCLSSACSFLPQQGQYPARQNVRDDIEQCARFLFAKSQERKRADLPRWQKFRRHPDPEHEANRANPPREA